MSVARVGNEVQPVFLQALLGLARRRPFPLAKIDEWLPAAGRRRIADRQQALALVERLLAE